jgi:hypothetical protein
VDDASEVIIKNLQGFPLILYLEIVWELLHWMKNSHVISAILNSLCESL